MASNLLTLRLALPEKLVASKPLSVRVYAVNPVTRKPFRGVRIEGTLAYDGEPDQGAKPFSRVVVRQATTSGAGEAVLVYPVQGAPGDTATLTVTGVMAGASGARITAKMDADVEISDRTTIRVETDKPLHKPGEAVHLRALIFDDAGRAAAKTDVTLTIKDPENKMLLEESLTTDRFGIAAYDWKTRTQTAPGEYEANFALDSTNYTGSANTTISIRRYELPEFSVAAAMDRGFYLDGQTPVVHIHAGYLFGKPVSAGTVRVVRAEQSWYGSAKKKAGTEVEQKATLDVNGDAELALKISDDFSEFNGNDWERYRDIKYRALVTDASTGRTEPRNFTLRLTRYPVHIYLYPLGGNDREGDFIVSTSYADGRPAMCKVELHRMDDDSNPLPMISVGTNRYGLARVHLRYAPDSSDEGQRHGLRLRIAAHDAEGRTSIFDDSVYENLAKSVWFTVAESLLKPGQAIKAKLHGEPGIILEVDAYSAQGLMAHQRVRMTHAAETLVFPATEGSHGVVTLIAYAMNSDAERYSYDRHSVSAYKSILYPEDRELKLKLSGARNSYAPGAAVLANLDVRDAGGTAVAGMLGVSVIDTAVEQRADTEEDADRLSRGGWWQNGSDGVAVPLNKVDMSGPGPVPDDLQLAAEVALVSAEPPAEVKLEFDDYDEARNEYTALIEHNLKPLGETVLAARTARLPGTLESVREMARRAGMDEALLIDPWNTPYKVQTQVEWNTESLCLVSAGPDKRFGTDDDFKVNVTQRNIFALPGEQLTRLLRQAVDAGRSLPGTVEALKQLARASGEDLDAVLDPNGRPYQYGITVGKRFYSVQVFRHDTAVDADGTLAGASVWSSPFIDYFAPTELRMEAALAHWADTGQTFPVTEAEVRQAFAAGGVEVDALRDPLGQPLRVKTAEVFALTSIQTVKAGDSLQEGSKQVTRQLHAIQIVRPRAQDSDSAAPDVVAQFLSAVTDQSGRDLKPQATDAHRFKGNSGAIGGTVADKSGADIPNASVTVKRASGENVAMGKTNREGTYLFFDLDSGLYTVEVSAPGFESYVLTEVRVSASSLTTVDVTLSVGAANETVMVSAEVSSIATSSANLATTIGMAGTPRTIAGKDGQATISEQTFTPRLRHVFEETAFWTPSLATDAGGRASLRFNLPDSLTTWKLHALASTMDGRIGVLDQKFRTFQPLFVDLDLPQVLTLGDEVQLPVNLRNYTGHSVTLPVTAKPADWLTLLTPSTVLASVSSDGSNPVVFGLRADHLADAGPFRVTAANAHEGDAVERTVRVHPDGEPRAVTAAGLLTSHSSTLSLDLPADAIPGSMHAELLLYPNLGAHVLRAMKAVLERPYGCGEQTISSTYPSLLYLELLKAGRPAGDTTNAPLAAQAQTYLQLGYDRLREYFDISGGLTYWGGNDRAPDPALTAYGIEFLSEAAPYVAVDRNYITRAIDWLLAQQQAEGGWKPLYGDGNAELNLYIAEVLEQSLSDDALAGATADRERITRAVARATGWAAASVAAVHAPYANALRLRLAIQANDAAAVARLREELAATAVHGNGGAHWSPQSYSPFYGWGRAGELETTAVALAALRAAAAPGTHTPAEATLAKDALFFMLGSEDRFGVWYSGQATVRVLQALLPAAVEQMKASAAGQEFRLSVNGVPLTGNEAQALRVDPKLLDAPRSLNLTGLLKTGHNELTFASTNGASLASAEATASYYIPWQGQTASSKTQTGSEAGLDFSYRCGADGAQTGLPIECTVAARRFGSQSYGMLLAEVGLPPGADVDRASLARLLDDWTISRYEVQSDRIVFYLWSWRPEGSRFSFRFKPRYAIHAKAAPAMLSDYYNPDLKVVLPPQTFLVTKR